VVQLALQLEHGANQAQRADMAGLVPRHPEPEIVQPLSPANNFAKLA